MQVGWNVVQCFSSACVLVVDGGECLPESATAGGSEIVNVPSCCAGERIFGVFLSVRKTSGFLFSLEHASADVVMVVMFLAA